jgi:hypothetical protein
VRRSQFGEEAAEEGFPEGGYYYDAGEDPVMKRKFI